MSYFPPRETGSSSRPTLPPIRDLFPDEFSEHPNGPHESPSMTLARLRVSDEDDYGSPARTPSGMPTPSGQPFYTPLGRSDPSSEYYQYDTHRDPRIDYRSSRIAHPASSHHYDGSATNPQAPHSRPHTASRPRAPSTSAPHVSLSTSPERSLHSRHRDPPHSQSHRYHNSPEAPYPYSPAITRHRSDMSFSVSDPSLRPRNISTNVHSDNIAEEDERTPVARFNPAAPVGMGVPATIGYYTADELDANITSKYECQYCGKGFNRPSSLKIHLNSHTGEKPFICPVESCGRSFSVLSNMRRHARVHSVPSLQESGNEIPSSSSIASTSTAPHGRWNHRRESSASDSSTSSRRSRSISSNDDDDNDKRTRRNVV